MLLSGSSQWDNSDARFRFSFLSELEPAKTKDVRIPVGKMREPVPPRKRKVTE